MSLLRQFRVTKFGTYHHKGEKPNKTFFY